MRQSRPHDVLTLALLSGLVHIGERAHPLAPRGHLRPVLRAILWVIEQLILVRVVHEDHRLEDVGLQTSTQLAVLDFCRVRAKSVFGSV